MGLSLGPFELRVVMSRKQGSLSLVTQEGTQVLRLEKPPQQGHLWVSGK